MKLTGRRDFLRSASMGAIGLPMGMHSVARQSFGAPERRSENDHDLVADQIQRENVWDLFRSFYGAKDLCDTATFLSFFAQSSSTVYQDAVADANLDGFDAIAGMFTGILGTVLARRGPGRLSKVFHVSGDTRYGAMAEYVDLRNTFYSTNGFTIQTVFDLDGGLIARDTDYWDSRELGMSDIVGPAVTAGVAVAFGAVHPGGIPRSASTPAPPGLVSLATGVTGRPSASRDMLRFATEFHSALKDGTVEDVLEFFAEDALYINPLIHQGPVLYGNFNRTIQVRGKQLIAKLIGGALHLLPDCRDSRLIHVVGGTSGGGFEWKAGGPFSTNGINRNGLAGCTSVDLVGGRIQRMSVRFDTFQIPTDAYDRIRTQIARVGAIDPPIGGRS